MLAIVLAAAAVPSPASADTLRLIPTQLLSVNGGQVWSGRVQPGSNITTVTATFTVPVAHWTCGAASNVAVWVGLGGYGSPPLAQAGVTVTPAGDSAWYELIDRYGNGPVAGLPVRVRAGDRITATVAFTAVRDVTLSVRNRTTGQVGAVTVRGAGRYYRGSTADWIVERAAYDPVTDTPAVAAIGPVTFTGGGSTGGTASRAVIALYLFGRTLRTLLSTQTLGPGAFTVTWHACR